MKPYKLLPTEIINTGKGIVNNTFKRFIGPADSVFSLFIRAFGHREDHEFNAVKSASEYQFVVYDQDPVRLEVFKEFLTWDGIVEDQSEDPQDKHFVSINTVIARVKEKFNIEVEYFPRNLNLGKIKRRDFSKFTEYWNLFRNCNFTFIQVDAIRENEKFIEHLRLLEDITLIDSSARQFLKFDFNPNNYDPATYKEALNNVLHTCWMRSIKRYKTVVAAANENNITYEDYAGKLYSKLNPSFCILPWMHIQYKPSGQAKLCCRYDTVQEGKEWRHANENDIDISNLAELYEERATTHLIKNSSMEQSFFSNYWNTARNLTIENKPISGCHKCYIEEQVPGEVATSMRLGSSILYNDGYLHKKPGFEQPKIEFLEVGFGNYCNLACLSCNSSLSTTWHDDENKFNDIAGDKLKRVVFPKLDNLKFEPTQETLNSLKLIKFTGGEPMINPEFIKFIELVCEKGKPEQMSLEIYTNCSYIPSPKLLANLAKFKDIQLNLSIDAHGSANDYIRYGSKWDHEEGRQSVSRSIKFWLEQGVKYNNLQIMMSTTLSILSVFEVPKLMSWWMDEYRNSGNKIVVERDINQEREYDGFFKLQVAFDPKYIDMNILPAEYYKEVLDWCNDHEKNFLAQYPEYPRVIECLRASVIKLTNTIKRCKGNADNAELLLDYLSKMDQVRGNNAETSIPVVVGKVKEFLRAQGRLPQN